MARFFIIGVNHLIEWLLGYRLFSSIYRGGYKRIKLFLLMGVANLLLLISFSSSIALNILINYLILFTFVFLSVKGSFVSIAFNVFLYEFLIIVAENLSLTAGRTIGMLLATSAMTYDQLFVLTVIDKLILVILIEIILFVRKRVRTEEREYGLANYIIIAVSVISVAILLCILVIMTGSDVDKDSTRLLTLSTAFILGLNAMIYILNAVIAKDNRRRSQMEMDIQREKDMDNYIHLLEQKINDERILIHDFKHHLLVISECLDRNEITEASRYMEALSSDRTFHSGFRYTNNSILNLLLARYDSVCRNKGIEFYIDAQNGNVDFMNYADITSLICNLMDNAIEASEKTIEPLIQLRMEYSEKSKMVVICINNSCENEPKKDHNGRFISSKAEDGLHGTGQRSIMRIIHKYNGDYNSYFDNEMGEFVIDIRLMDR